MNQKGGNVESSTIDTLTDGQVTGLIEAAIGQWHRAGLSSSYLEQLRGVEIQIADLSGARLGEATGQVITLDVNAAGYGWFIDATPFDDVEFNNPQPTIGAPKPVGHAESIDLLTVVTHELGHVLGLDDTHDPDDAEDLMYGWLDQGSRRRPDLSTVDAVFASLP